ncbi:MAG: hypothetical protein ACI9R3_005834, partial [Verrucomicrobiales bacterium]
FDGVEVAFVLADGQTQNRWKHNFPANPFPSEEV